MLNDPLLAFENPSLSKWPLSPRFCKMSSFLQPWQENKGIRVRQGHFHRAGTCTELITVAEINEEKTALHSARNAEPRHRDGVSASSWNPEIIILPGMIMQGKAQKRLFCCLFPILRTQNRRYKWSLDVPNEYILLASFYEPYSSIQWKVNLESAYQSHIPFFSLFLPPLTLKWRLHLQG